MYFSEYLAETRLIHRAKVPTKHAQLIYDHAMKFMHDFLGVDVKLYDTYSAQKSPEMIQYKGTKFLVIDHALIEYFRVLNSLARFPEKPDMVAAALQRPLAEACRNAGHLKHYAFFIKRAIEIKPLVKVLEQAGPHSLDTYWQMLTVLAHEAGHAIPKGSEFGKNLWLQAKLDISIEVNRIIEKSNAMLASLLEDIDVEQTSSNDDVGVTNDLKMLLQSTNQNGASGIDSSVFLSKAQDDKFVEEIMCDSFAVGIIQTQLERYGNPDSTSSDIEVVADNLLATYKTFLNMRFHKYIEDICKLADSAQSEEIIDPLKQNGLVEFTIRGNFFASKIIQLWSDWLAQIEESGDSVAFEDKLRLFNRQHTEALFMPMNQLLEDTLLAPEFSTNLDQLLEEDGYDVVLFETAPWKVLNTADAFWHVTVC
jgi:hypothetical protein